ncbi:hypothetical protein SDC9_91406 [bioreactor metagenome]|uniref:Type II secretion system protein GspF domain-containing protein n=1 Tax=bioreactor metagenome TaxID=1076179 RepID=A0A644ZUZ3_9ZZZZ
MSEQVLWILSLVLAAAGIGALAVTLLWKDRRSTRVEERVEKIMKEREAQPSLAPLFAMADAQAGGGADAALAQKQTVQSVMDSLKSPAWLQSAPARILLADEDRKLLESAGMEMPRSGLIYIVSRAVLAVVLPVLVLTFLPAAGHKALMYGFFAFGLGLMLPKWLMRSRATKRRAQVSEELPLFVDLLRLLQGVGLSIDQSLQIMATEFGSVLKVISAELALANRMYSTGRTREQSLQRLSLMGDDDDMSAVVNLLVQVDRHGGAVQEPLKEYSVRLREKRQARFKEKIGTITVKMTGVMVLTLLPSLLVITAGPGFTAVIRSLSSLGGK